MRIKIIVFTALLFALSVQNIQAKDKNDTHSFKITGSKRVPLYADSPSGGEMAVEYDSASTDHLYITEYKPNGFRKTKSRLLFKGKNFNLNRMNISIEKGELLMDGIQTDYREDDSVGSELLYKEEKLLAQTFFYPNGKKQISFFGDEEVLNGEYKVWYPNGQLSFSGNYKDNRKDGEFQQFDQAGILVKKGVYQEGKLISGDPIVQDLIYENPDKPAQYIGGDKAFNEYLKMKSADFTNVLLADKELNRLITLELTVTKTGSIRNLAITSEANPDNPEIVKSVFEEFPGFKPALVEGIPVTSKLKLNLILNEKGLQTELGSEVSTVLESLDSPHGTVYSETNIEGAPEYPGGQIAMRKFIAYNVRYPVLAQQKGIMGKVFVSFIIEADGSIAHISVKKSIHPLLDAEAVRVVKLMPRWNPGTKDGKAVRVEYTVPVNFVLQ